MPERQPVVEGESISYEGVFSFKEVYAVIREWMDDKGYVPVEKRVHESVTKSGKHIEVDFEPFKKYTDYAQSVIRVHLSATELKDVEVTRDGHKKKMQQGKLRVAFDSWLETDYEARWETSAMFYVLRTMFEKYVYTPFLSGFVSGVREDTNFLKDQLKAYLNIERQ